MLRAVLAPLKIVVFLIHMLASYLIFIVLLYPLKLFGVSKFRWKNKMVKGWAKRGLKLLGIELEVKGPVPEPPFFLVSNHLSYLDIPVYYSILNTTFVSKAEVRNWPVIGAMARSLHVIFIDRQKRRDVVRVNREISAEIGDEQGVLMFPEATTSSGEGVLRFRASLLDYAARSKEEVSYAAIRYSTGKGDHPAHLSVCWWGEDMPILKHLIKMLSNRTVKAEVTFGKDTITSEDRKELAEKLEEKVREIFVPVVAPVSAKPVPEEVPARQEVRYP